MANLLDKCAECGEDFYGTHSANCSKEADLDMCGVCDRFYHNQGKTINNQCVCERGRVMAKCVGRDNKVCGKEFFDPQFPDDNLCDQCYAWYKEREGE